MGTPIPRNEVGISCPNCFGPGKIWDGEPAPKYLYMTFYGWMPGWSYDAKYESILLSPQILTQDIEGCSWEIIAGGMHFIFWLGPDYSQAWIVDTIYADSYFGGKSDNPCDLVIANTIKAYGDGAAFGGWFSVSWNPEDL